MTSITIPKTLTKSDSGPFKDSNIKTAVVEEGIANIPDYLFYGCTTLTSVTLPEKEDNLDGYVIGSYAFDGCTGLTEITIPDTVTKIGDYAFYGCSYLSNIVVPSGVASIGNYAFGECTRLKKLYLPDSVTTFGWNIFNKSDNTVVQCKEYSFTTIYCIDNNIPVEFISTSFDDDSNLLLDRTNTSYVANTVSSLSNGYISLNADYRFKSGLTGVTPQKIFIYIPSTTELIESSLKLDGRLLTEYEYDDNILEIPVSNNSGSISYSLKPTEDSILTSYAYITYKKGSSDNGKEVIGIINESIPLITIESSEYTSDNSVEVKGVAPAETEVTLFVNGTKQGTVKSNKAGIYTGTVTISDVSDYKAYKIKAQALNSEGDTIASETEVTYLTAAPELKTLTMDYNNHSDASYELYPKKGGTPVITFNPSCQFKFTAEIENPESVNGVYITSTRNNVTKYMKAEYDEDSGKYVASGYFDETNKGYVPGKISVSYDLKHKDVNIGEEVEWNKLAEAVPEGLTKDQVTVQKNTEKEVKATIDWSSIDSSLQDATSDISIDVLEEMTGAEINEVLGLYDEFTSLLLPGENAEKFEVYVKNESGEPLEGFTYLVHDIATSKWVEMVVDFHDNGKMNNPAEQISEALGKVGTVTDLLTMVYKTYGIEKDCDELRQKVMSEVPIDEQAESLKKIDDFEDDQINFMLVTTALPLLVTSLGIATGPAGLIFSGLLGAITATSGLFWQYRTADILGEDVSIKWKIDPSGYVYDIDTNERLSGVKTSLYFVSYEESDENTKPADSNYGTFWNAEEWDQINPIMTDSNGCYAWDVPEGWWRVKYEKENYITAWSDWLPVPPEQTDVNIGLRSTVSKTKTVTWIVDGDSTTETYKVGEKIVKPENPVKSGYIFKGWTPEVPATMPAEDLTFTAVFEKNTTPSGTNTCPNCGKVFTSEAEYNAHVGSCEAEPTTKPTDKTELIRKPSQTEITYGDSIILHADVENLPEGAYIEWTADNANFTFTVSEDGTTCTITPAASGDTVFTVTVVDKNGDVISSDTQAMTAKAGLWQKIVAFFKKLFGMTKVYSEIFERR